MHGQSLSRPAWAAKPIVLEALQRGRRRIVAEQVHAFLTLLENADPLVLRQPVAIEALQGVQLGVVTEQVHGGPVLKAGQGGGQHACRSMWN